MSDRRLGQYGIDFFEARSISAETAVRYGVYTGRKVRDGVVPDERGEVLVFPYTEGGREVNAKYRTEPKFFWQSAGGRRTFWNSDVLDDPALTEGRAALVITEGEPDGLAVADSGYPFVVSVPDGAPAVPKGKRPDELERLDTKTEVEGKYEFIWNNKDRLRKIKRIVIAVDTDDPGKRLEAELVRRLSAAKCQFVTYPPDLVVIDDDAGKWPQGRRPCKDLNEVLMYFGPERVSAVINAAKPYPVRGIYKLSEYPERDLVTYTTGITEFRNRLLVHIPEFMVITGIPSSGKSTWMLCLVASLCETHGWRAAICAPEMPAVPNLRDALRRWKIGKKPLPLEPETRRADDWIENRFVFIDTDPTGLGGDDETFDVDWVIDRATDAVLRDGIRILVIDPWNELEHARKGNETLPDYIAKAIRSLKRFGRLYQVMVIVVAHPTKDVAADKTGKIRPPNLYDIEGAAHWYNKCDHGIVVHRDHATGETEIKIKKVRFEGSGTFGGTGMLGDVTMYFNVHTGRYQLDDPRQKNSNVLSAEDAAALAGR